MFALRDASAKDDEDGAGDEGASLEGASTPLEEGAGATLSSGDTPMLELPMTVTAALPPLGSGVSEIYHC